MLDARCFRWSPLILILYIRPFCYKLSILIYLAGSASAEIIADNIFQGAAKFISVEDCIAWFKSADSVQSSPFWHGLLYIYQSSTSIIIVIGPVLRLYDLGQKRLLKKCENMLFSNTIVSIHTYRDRIYVGDIQESFHYCKYRRDENQLYIVADDVYPRWLAIAHHVDFDTMAGSDKFGNVYFVRLPQDVSDEIEEDPTGGKIKWEHGKINGAPNKLEEIVQFHVGDVVSSMQKASLIPGGGECIIYGTVMGSLGSFLPFSSRDDVEFFSHLEMHMRQEHPLISVPLTAHYTFCILLFYRAFIYFTIYGILCLS